MSQMRSSGYLMGPGRHTQGLLEGRAGKGNAYGAPGGGCARDGQVGSRVAGRATSSNFPTSWLDLQGVGSRRLHLDHSALGGGVQPPPIQAWMANWVHCQVLGKANLTKMAYDSYKCRVPGPTPVL